MTNPPLCRCGHPDAHHEGQGLCLANVSCGDRCDCVAFVPATARWSCPNGHDFLGPDSPRRVYPCRRCRKLTFQVEGARAG